MMLDAPYAEVARALEREACEGDTITRVDIRRHPPSARTAADRALGATSEAAGLEPATTDVFVVRAYLRLHEGGLCSEVERRESERLLRAQKFIASAAVTVRQVSPGYVAIRVDVVDEWPYVVGGGVGSGHLSSLRLGTINLMGRGLSVVGSVERGGVYRNGAGIRLEQYGLAGRPAYAELTAERRPLGGTLHIEASQPFLTYQQRGALRGSVTEQTEFVRLARPSGDDVAVQSSRSAYDIAWVGRAGSLRRDGLVGLAGLALMREEVISDSGSVIVSDSGLVQTLDSALTGRYPSFSAERVGLILGVRALNFVTVDRFSTLRAAQDVGRGIRASLVIAPSLSAARGEADVLLSGDVYAGMGSRASFVTLRAGAEARGLARQVPWRGVAASARVNWNRVALGRRSGLTSLTAAALGRALVPSQLTFRDLDDGLLGSAGSHDAGGRRVVLRQEERLLVDWFRNRADVALAIFADVGKLWRGDVPYGATSPVRGSVGISLLGSYPNGKRTFRLDLALPLNPGSENSRFAVRLSSADRTGTSWMEAGDIARVRASSGPATLTRW